MAEEKQSAPPAHRTFVIRQAKAHDLDDLVRLEADAFTSDRLSRRRLRALSASPTAALLVAHRDEAIVGYVLVLTRSRSRAARLYSLAVVPEMAGRGVGSRLLAAGEAAASARGAHSLRLEVRPDNEAAIRFYERHGYAAIGRRDAYYQDGMTALRYARNLRGTAQRHGPLDRLVRAA